MHQSLRGMDCTSVRNLTELSFNKAVKTLVLQQQHHSAHWANAKLITMNVTVQWILNEIEHRCCRGVDQYS